MTTAKQMATSLITNPAYEGAEGPTMPDGDHGGRRITADDVNNLAQLVRMQASVLAYLVGLCELAYYRGWDDAGVALNKAEAWDDGPTKKTLDSLRSPN